jgi:3-methyladenine DNA glycosylase AlkC
MKLKEMFNQGSVGALGQAIQGAYPAFDPDAFATDVFDEAWPDRELKQRMRHISHVLHRYLPADLATALEVLRRALPALEGQGFVKMVFPDYVEQYGLDDWEVSIAALEVFTQEASAEFAIRPFIVHHAPRTLAQMLAWAGHSHPDVRRLASEGCRPRLPWGIALPNLQADPSPILPILDQLKDDESETVRRSVANNLNDISKDNPDVTLAVLKRWQAEVGDPPGDDLAWVTRHALRTLLKQGHPTALALLGYPSPPAIQVRNVTATPRRIRIGDKVTLAFDVESTGDRPQKLMIDYVVHHMRANGHLSPKVFKLAKRTIQPGEVLHIEKRHSLAPVTTRRYYPGRHALEPQINGQVFEQVLFLLEEEQV